MKKIYSRLSKQVLDSLVVIILLTLIFAYNDRKEVTTIASWTSNVVLTFVVVTLSVLFLVLGYKLAARYYGNTITFKLWAISREEGIFSMKAYHIPLTKYFGQILAIFLTLISSGLVYFTAISTFSGEIKSKRKKFRQVTGYESAMTSIIGLVFSFMALFFFKSVGSELGVLINTWIIVGNIIPFSSLPGAYIAMKSRTSYIFVAALSVFLLILIGVLSIKAAVAIALILAVILTIVYFRYMEYKGKIFGDRF
ncbi:hypothetical protein J4426_00125 [Candidatus Woesearchaeota archaeon]|nr:hypothetical protein [Candidatus Woesearchaeota archaeon]